MLLMVISFMENVGARSHGVIHGVVIAADGTSILWGSSLDEFGRMTPVGASQKPAVAGDDAEQFLKILP